jgi:hypothetical protein
MQLFWPYWYISEDLEKKYKKTIEKAKNGLDNQTRHAE